MKINIPEDTDEKQRQQIETWVKNAVEQKIASEEHDKEYDGNIGESHGIKWNRIRTLHYDTSISMQPSMNSITNI